MVGELWKALLYLWHEARGRHRWVLFGVWWTPRGKTERLKCDCGARQSVEHVQP
ncbi:MAG: hypothetical protein ACM3UX_00835 [Candidatus Woesearchaeota archaeon]